MDSLRQDFASAGLPLELRAVPLAFDRSEGAENIVQMDIARDARRGRAPERFRIYPGHDENRLEVLGVDPDLSQLVLLVDEPSRAFNVRVTADEALRGRMTVVRTERRHAWVVQHTEARERRFLCGMDEQHLFIALLPDAAGTVRAAHESLRDARVDEAERRAGRPAVRQGEWFFVPLSEEDARTVRGLARRSLRVARRVGIAEGAGIARVGREHVVDELLVMDGIPDAGGDTSRRIYVRGAVRHPDHRTLVLDDWSLTIPNREAIEAPVPGVGWID